MGKREMSEGGKRDTGERRETGADVEGTSMGRQDGRGRRGRRRRRRRKEKKERLNEWTGVQTGGPYVKHQQSQFAGTRSIRSNKP